MAADRLSNETTQNSTLYHSSLRRTISCVNFTLIPQNSPLKTIIRSWPSPSTQALNIPPQLKSATTLPTPSLPSSMPIIPPSPSPVLCQRSSADSCSIPFGPATDVTAFWRDTSPDEKRAIADAVRTADRRRNESPLPVPEIAAARRLCLKDCFGSVCERGR
jgi:hypothetical protein